jgi:hypothetical protein
MNKKRMMSRDKLSCEAFMVEALLNDLQDMYLDYIDDAVERSDLSDAKQVIDYIKTKGD